jgi:hypothetical protein
VTSTDNSHPPASEPEPPTTKGARTRGAPLLKAFKRAVSGIALVVLLLGGYLYFYSTHQQTYLTGRNYRALASMSTQVGAKLLAADKLLLSAGKILQTPGGTDSAADFIPAYRHLALRDSQQVIYAAPNAEICSKTPVDTPNADGKWRRVAQAPPYCLYRTFEIVASDTSPVDTSRTAQPSGVAYLNAATYLKGDVQARVFDKVVIADVSGQVLAEAGEPDIVLTRLDAIVKGRGADSLADWRSLTAGSNVGSVTVSGKSYRFFLEPCCRLGDGSQSEQPLLVAGLVDNGQFVRDTFRISLSWVTILCCTLILMALAWPFLKFRLMGERQPVRLADGMHLGLSSFLASALITIFVLDLYAYTMHREARDAGLRRLSGEIILHFRKEIAAARDELERRYSEAVVRRETVEGPERRRIRKDESMKFPFFESWSLVDSAGRQVRKWSTDAFVQPPIPVGDRAYFREITTGRGWTAPRPGPAPGPGSLADRRKFYYLESTVSRTTGKRQAVLSIPVNDPATPAATMALELLSLIGVVLPPGYGFAVLDDSGRVLFHSDPTRNLDESFFSEADGNRRLRSALVARTADTLNLRYGGSDYRAHVSPVPDVPWTLVTFLDKESGRITNAESLLSSIYLVLVYTIALAGLAALILVFIPSYRVPWLWPDRRLYSTYLRIGVINGLFLAAFLTAFATLERDDLLAAGFLLPLAAMATSWVSLTRRRDGTAAWLPRVTVALSSAVLGLALLGSEVAGWRHYAVYALASAGSFLAMMPPPKQRTVATSIARVYQTAAVLFILVIGAMPAAAFFRVASAAHTEMLIKGGQLHLARRLEQRADSIRLAYADELGMGKSGARAARLCTPTRATDLCGLDLYFDFFFGTSLAPSTVPRPVTPSRTASAALVGVFLAPYRPRVSVDWRGTYRPGADDHTWSWETRGDRMQFHGSPTPGRPAVALASVVPGLLPGTLEDGLTGSLLAGLLLLSVWAVANFVARRFFLIDVTDPVIVSRDRRIQSVGGTNLFVVCRDSKEEESIRIPKAGKPFDLRNNLRDGDLRWVVRSVSEGDLVLLRHFEYKPEDQATTKAKVSLLDTLVHEYNCNVVILSGQHRDGSPLGLRAAWRLVEATGQPHSGAAQALESLVLVDAGRWLRCPRKGERRCRPALATSSAVESVIVEERRCDRHLQEIWRGLEVTLRQHSPRLAKQGREELLDAMGERAEPYFREIWESCRPAERSVLVHLADSGLVNEKDRRILRRLLARGLIRREPNFVVMNETFRRYLLARAVEVEAELPPQPSAWDAVRSPVMAAGTGLVIVLLVTQQELFSATTAIVAALGTGVATLSKITGLFDRRSANRTSAG